jgi:hypothetical protein
MFDQVVGFDSQKLLRFCRSARLAILAVFGLMRLATIGEASDRASWIVHAALRSEIDLNADERAGLIDAALQRDPKSTEAHWARGDVRVRGQWLTLEEAAADAMARADLKRYQELRARTDDTVKGQVRLAEYCRTRHLAAQERAHWTAVLTLAPDHAEARKRLGQVLVDEAWIDKRLLEQQKKTLRATSEYMKKHGERMSKLAKALQDQTLSSKMVEKELEEFRDPLAISGLETLFSASSEEGAHCAVATIAAIPAPEASLSLVRHALDFPAESVQKLAMNSLKRRDENSFVPALLAELQSPMEKQDEFAVNAGNQLVWRQRVSFETQDSKRVTTFDRFIQFPRQISAAFVANTVWTQQRVEEADSELAQLNRTIKERNRRVIQVLSQTTDVPASTETESDDHSATISKKSPEDWWNWWNDRIESYPADSKAVLARYQSSYVSIPPPPSVTIRYNECLAAGTPIWTETGPIAVDQIKVGDLVLAKNPRTGELKFAPVLATTTRPPELLFKLKLKNETVRATGGHPFWVSGKGWVRARLLQPGLGLHAARGVTIVDAIEEESEATTTYNLVVDDYHSYFVGKNLLLSHDNTACDPVVNRVPGLRDDNVKVTAK